MRTTVYFVILAVAFASCGGGQQKRAGAEGQTVTIVHTLDTVEVPVNPQRVVVLDFSALENLDYLGIKPVAVPKSGIPSHLSRYKDDASIADAGSIVEINLEKINEVQPDLIILGGRLRDFYDDLSKIAPVIYPSVYDAGDFLTAFERNLDDLGKIFERQDDVETAYADIRAKIDTVRQKVAASNEKALIVLHNKGRFSAYGSGSRFGIIHDVLGVPEAAEGLGTHIHGNPISSEFIGKVNPDILFIVDRSAVVANDRLDKSEVENQLVRQTNAYKNGKIFYLNPEMWYLAGGGITSVNAMIDEVAQAF
ncbi:MAG TPA: ABC transporter [Porphyromonadaceae bacterium]|jgi:iron complex transport system substrate-binding protein|uniref:siderophore ABC transporter substrate-binding protein n=1 Tax=Limibacterium fermenti TaxID=3229863 RepID=UPI000E955F35|nr:ABC transporter [Porphyromonadaceae bacterium]HBX45336.1 ABC transporter [Porphyromonadaceae bacterium]